MRIILLFTLIGMLSLTAKGQTTVANDSIPSTQTVDIEEVDGVFEFASYLGKKFANEVGNRLNLKESEEGEAEEEQVKRVRIKLGPIKIERIEKK